MAETFQPNHTIDDSGSVVKNSGGIASQPIQFAVAIPITKAATYCCFVKWPS